MQSRDDNSRLTETVRALVDGGDTDKARETVEISSKIQELTHSASREKQRHRWRNAFAGVLVTVFALECLSANAAFFVIVGYRIPVPQWVGSVFFISVFGQIAYLTRLAVTYFFHDGEQ